MLTHVQFNYGANGSENPLSLDLDAAITIIVGPNHSGKSQVLREIGNFCMDGSTPQLVLKKITYKKSDKETAGNELERLKRKTLPEEKINANHIPVLLGHSREQLHEDSFKQIYQNPNDNVQWFAQAYLRHYVLRLNGIGRMSLLDAQPKTDLKYPVGSIGKLFTNNLLREKLRNKIFDATGYYLVLDYSPATNIEVRFSQESPINERSIEPETVEYMTRAKSVAEMSDGIRAYSGILLQLYAGDPKLILIDEPEAFLHPSLAQKLGKELATGAASQGKQIFISTHSPHFVMGAVTAGAKINIVRVTYDGIVGTARLLPNDELKKLMKDPMLRSVGVLSGLFFNNVIVGEGDTDRSFYQEINERLNEAEDTRGIPDALFLNAQNKQTIPKIIKPLRKLGIPAVGIVDIDVVKDGGIEWTRFLEAMNIPGSDFASWQLRRDNTLKALRAKAKEFKRQGGVDLLESTEKQSALTFFEDLQTYGLFIVIKGEVEKWLTTLDISRNKKTWLDSIFSKMGDDPNTVDYVKPENGDVWDFIGIINKWLKDPKRRGLL